jgi:Leucine-rich repeat (LRR) protein
MGLLTDLLIWGMERGTLAGTIPTEIGFLSNLIFLDLDFNRLTGTLSSELYSLKNLTQLDLNDNLLSGNIDGLGGFPFMEFLQIHRNINLTGTIPLGIGTYTDLTAFTLHATSIVGTMPSSVCDLLITNDAGNGVLSSLIANCAGTNALVECECCTDCR